MSAGKVLVIDDDPQIRRVMKVILAGERYEVVEARSGEAALVKFKTPAGTLTLKQSDKNFPPRDARFFDLGDLLNLTGVKDLKRKEVQVVLDTAVAPVLNNINVP